MTGEELVVPRLRARSEPLESLRISESMDQFILVHVTDARFEIFHVRVVSTRRYENAEEGQGSQGYRGGSKHGCELRLEHWLI